MLDVDPKTRNVLAAEQEATRSLIDLIGKANEDERKPITILLGNYRLLNVTGAGADQIRGDPKADIALIDNNNREVGFISHKKAGGAKAYQQYGGISKKSGTAIYQSPIVNAFVRDLEMIVKQQNENNLLTSGQAFYRIIPNDPEGRRLVAKSIYGPNHSGGNVGFGRESVHCIGQGSPILNKSGPGIYKLTFSESIHYAKELDWCFKGPYAAILAATYRGGRKVENSGMVIRNVRAGIYPYDFISNRKAKEI